MIQNLGSFIIRTSLILFSCFFLLTACSKDVEVFNGIVHTVDFENKRILVISQLKDSDLNKDYKELLNSGEYSQVIWVNKVAPSEYEKGDEIEVSYESSDDSFPAQVNAKKIIKVKN
ncbi:DUF3221 domain-containing protein [Paenibacillus typhae]|uniref:DUF3221 domain-containing protein n=1 Tax=Paenibacillus typhae TaxID=1174501 RepID=UPI001C8E448A|nr:DUF3221 domain-containing protein [Paenibacillus typhae]MBY0012045.1 DUF3221 domain-containing protein [Paenibacillus typhae]